MRRKRILDICLIASASALILGFGVGIFFQPQGGFSESENRELAKIKRPTVKNILDGSFFLSVSELYGDNFPARSRLTAAKAFFEGFILQKRENNGVIFAKDGYLIDRGEYESLDMARRNTELLYKLKTAAEERGKPCLVAIAPRGIDVLENKLPSGYSGSSGEVWGVLCGREYTDLTEPVAKRASNGEYAWFRTDHHWTSRGAYAAYASLSHGMGYETFPENAFSVESVGDGFFGTLHSKSGGAMGDADRVELFRYIGDTEYTVTVEETGKSFFGFYDLSALNSKDKYRVFIGGNYPIVTVRSSKETGRERLLLVKDSYSNSLVPFLARHYDITMVDPRYYTGDWENLIAEADRVLILQGIDTIATTRLTFYLP